jgi:hypothetical protein
LKIAATDPRRGKVLQEEMALNQAAEGSRQEIGTG